MYLPDIEIERVAVSVITEFGADAERVANDYAMSAKDRGFDATAHIWGQVRECIAGMQVDDIRLVLRAA